MRSGTARTRVTVQQRSEASDVYGSVVPTWSTYLECWAEYLPNGGGEMVMSAREVTQADAMFRMRYRSGVTKKMRIKMGTRYFDIVRIDDPRGRHDVIEIYARETI